MTKTVISWKEYGELIDGLVLKVAHYVLPSNIVLLAIGRGGYIPGVAISHALDKPLYTIGISTYEGTEVTTPKYTAEYCFNEILEAENILIIDDIYETGTTMNFVENEIYASCDQINGIWKAITISKNPDYIGLDFIAATYPKDDWIVLPYEKSLN